MNRYRVKVREVIRYEIELMAPSAAAARFAIQRPFEPQAEGIELIYRSDFESSRATVTHLEIVE